ncbi:hypothetical protein [Pelosinus baikalensis]|uniref:Uncharacterized protein n=1 Tax=Pelosinus baikalensis TaxID=2892015 RepID=A0ABS8HXX6_9FIRM|nr:hypothetical protein [Pelosinus baikalensis]MCC5468018.1 hypothetical protein [Pelosinus baikalensis]
MNEKFIQVKDFSTPNSEYDFVDWLRKLVFADHLSDTDKLALLISDISMTADNSATIEYKNGNKFKLTIEKM